MTALPRPLTFAMTSVALPATLLVFGVAVVAMQLGLPTWPVSSTLVGAPPTVSIAAASHHYRAEGQFLRDGDVVSAPMVDVPRQAPLVIMKYQVSQADYAACVAAGVCHAAEPRYTTQGNVPVTGVNFTDAETYAKWLSQQTGQSWALPTDAEWAFAAGADFTDDSDLIADNANPAIRWLANYEQEAARDSDADRHPLPLGSLGTNSNGVADMGGNVWEWTQTCDQRTHLGKNNEVLSVVPACNVKILDGQHRAPMSFFIRDAQGGGCSVGIPPSNIGFRLVRQQGWTDRLAAWFGWTTG